ncbi:MAG TPA: ATP-binding cassette domain-containing protein [Erysipelothrix sp.]|nr:ATP-binding cassette domain-containing protein [Erysipelothrix sp.]
MRVLKELMWFFKQEKKSYFWGLLSLLLISLISLIPPKLLGYMIDVMEAQTMTPQLLMMGIGGFILVALMMYGLRYIWRIFIFGTSFKLENSLRDTIFKHLTRLSSSFFQERRAGELMALATHDLNSVQAVAGRGVLQMFDSIFSGVSVLLAMFLTISWKLTLIAILPMPLLIIASQYLSKKLHKTFHVAQEAFSDMNNRVLENINGIKVTKTFGQEIPEINRFKGIATDVYQKNLAVTRYDALFDPVIIVISTLCIFLTLIAGSYFVMNNEISTGDLATIINYIYQLNWPMMAIGFMYNTMNRGLVSYERINELLKEEPEIINLEKHQYEIPKGDISFDIQHFQYPGQQEDEVLNLDNVSFYLKAGETLGIVGKTGSGKSTIIRLLLREFDDFEGLISFGKKHAKEYNLYAYRDGFGYVPQDPFLFSMSIEDNIRFGKPDASIEDVHQAAKLADVHDDIMGFELQYDTIIGERGVSLSGGQKQRVAMARAILLNPECLILDDALSAVDAKTEEIILHNLRDIRQDKTTIIVAHRFSALKHAHHILVLDHGRVIEEGAHDALVDLQGWYSEIYKLQENIPQEVAHV